MHADACQVYHGCIGHNDAPRFDSRMIILPRERHHFKPCPVRDGYELRFYFHEQTAKPVTSRRRQNAGVGKLFDLIPNIACLYVEAGRITGIASWAIVKYTGRRRAPMEQVPDGAVNSQVWYARPRGGKRALFVHARREAGHFSEPELRPANAERSGFCYGVEADGLAVYPALRDACLSPVLLTDANLRAAIVIIRKKQDFCAVADV
ncbi:MAG: hypothetical protein D8M55_05275 [Chloroflexi bacterium]|nr:hypothetical protein [Chloroflexota bacterium]